ncbi:MAG: gliding motility-associated C-terminal domain-containing protein [Bacteroidales bacterium]|nr:gliding motility-associated C-terminal domain-containing protein [Bacteroidales bacterium]
MKKLAIVFLLFVAILSGNVFAQGGAAVIDLDATTHGTSQNVPGEGLFIKSEGGTAGNNYVAGHDYYITVVGGCATGYYFCLKISEFDIAPCDTLFIYDGPSINSPVRIKANNEHNNLTGKTVFVGPTNNSQTLTIRLKVAAGSPTGKGFNAQCGCDYPCEVITPVLDTFFYKTRNGVIYDTFNFAHYVDYDTIYERDNSGNILTNADGTPQIRELIPKPWTGINLCQGDGIIFNAHGLYTHDHGYYTPNDDSTTFHWNFGTGDTLVEQGAYRVEYNGYHELSCYDVVMTISDHFGCTSNLFETVVVRLAQNPIKTIYDLATICNSDSLFVNVGYDGENGTMTLKQISFERVVSKTFDARTFIPDGPNCAVTCYQAPVTFTEFPNGKTITAAEDICSVCVNFEHEFMGDYELSIICPTNQKAVIKYKNSGPGHTATGMSGGSGKYTGWPFGGDNHHSYDGTGGTAYCDSLDNPAGIGMDYCFTRNTADYMYIGGTEAQSYLACTGAALDTNGTVNFPAPPPGYRTGAAHTATMSTRAPSWHAQKDHYYAPADDFSQLAGCPLNGTWNIELCDTWGSDNGWVFNWSMDICGVSSGNGCEYQVALDSVVWTPDSTYGDFYHGYYRGAYVRRESMTDAYIGSPDTAGDFRLIVKVYDEFGCVWDTSTFITTVWTPQPNLPNDTTLCDVESILLCANDAHTLVSNQSYMWEPYGDISEIIQTRTGSGGQSTLYMVEVTNSQHDIRCRARDSIRVMMYPQPKPNFDPGVYPLEGCEPFNITFNNTSKDGNNYRWEFGDGTVSTEMSPTHSYSAGSYGLKYYITGDGGCRDSLVYENLITVYSNPQAKFSWLPLNPSVTAPYVTFQNATIPQSPDNKYYWEIQYDKDYNYSYHTLTDVNPTFEWDLNDGDITGNYIVRLIAKTVNQGPSGMIVECVDTLENNILVVNDFLQFPSVVTPNGDGINDIFEITNLIEGFAYPVNELSIYNRWGKKVFSVKNITQPSDFWDPSKTDSPDGTYFWHFVGDGYRGPIERNGSVEVLR